MRLKCSLASLLSFIEPIHIYGLTLIRTYLHTKPHEDQINNSVFNNNCCVVEEVTVRILVRRDVRVVACISGCVSKPSVLPTQTALWGFIISKTSVLPWLKLSKRACDAPRCCLDGQLPRF